MPPDCPPATNLNAPRASDWIHGASRRAVIFGGFAVFAATGIQSPAVLAQQRDESSADTPTSAERQAMREEASAFMQRYSVPGLSVSIARRGRLVYSEAFGLADTTSGERLTTSHRFRIASVSKPITSVAIFSLIESGRLQLSDRVFGSKGVLGTAFGQPSGAAGADEITVEHLLTHTAGGWGNDGKDPMFVMPQLGHAELIRWTLRTQPLRTRPGTAYAYSNFGYCVLGRVIERVTGQRYDAYVREAVLRRAEITDMSIAGNTLAERQPNEVRYQASVTGDPYAINVRRMDSHGGWLARPMDLVAFATHVDGFSPSSLLNPDTLRTMTIGSLANKGYAKGWLVNSAGNWWHNGSLPGTTSIMVRTSSRMCWAALANIGGGGSPVTGDIDRLLWAMARIVPRWGA